MRNRLVLLALCVATFAGAVIGIRLHSNTSNCTPAEHAVTWDVFHGTVTTTTATYIVNLDEDDRGCGMRRIVHIQPEGQEGSITGHDYNDDGKWDRIFYCEMHTKTNGHSTGCNSVLRADMGWEFEPCPSDAGEVSPFTDEQITFAIAELDAALAARGKTVQVTQKWRWNPTQKAVLKVYDKRDNGRNASPNL
ncbi:MAG TPA: hypothetical protein VJJ22_03605 [Candidatus Paceibacterota bacterium]